MDVDTYRARIRFRVATKLNVADSKYLFKVAGRDTLLQAPSEEVLIQDSEWLLINTRGFADNAEARSFGRNLQTSLQIASAVTRLGIDPGRDAPTCALSEHVKNAIAVETGAKVRDNVHGLDVFIDDPNVVIFGAEAAGSVRAHPEPFLSHAAELHRAVAGLS